MVATPLGNLGDLSLRAKDTLKNVDKILAEDTRTASRLLSALNLPPKSLESFFEHNESRKLSKVLNWLEQGLDLALISEAGTPLIADPGFPLVKKVRLAGFKVIPIPGPSAPIVALMGAGISCLPFTFLGFLPKKPEEIKKIFSLYAYPAQTLVFFERKNRVLTTLKLAHQVLGKREFCLARELTKIHEEFINGYLDDLSSLDETKLRGEFTVVIGPGLEVSKTPEQEVKQLILNLRSRYKVKELAKIISEQVQGWSTKEVYQLCLQLNQGPHRQN